MSSDHKVRIDVWSDYVCPFCYLELPVLDRAQEELGKALAVEWHAFELRPEPVPTLHPGGDYLSSVWARAVNPMAEDRGMALRLPPVQPRSRKAFEAVEHARDEGRFDEMHRAIFKAFFEEGLDIGATSVLLELGNRAGLNQARLQAALASGFYTERVLEDQQSAQRAGIRAVPALLIHRGDGPADRARLLSGAVEYAELQTILERMQGAPFSQSGVGR